MKKNLALSWFVALRNLTILALPLYIFRFSFHSLTSNFLEVVIGLVVLVYVWLLFTDPTERSAWKRERLAYFLPFIFLVAIALSLPGAGDVSKAIGIWKGWFLLPVVFYYLWISPAGRPYVKHIFPWIGAVLVFVSLWALAQRFGVIGLLFYQKSDPASFNDYLVSGSFRAFGPFESPNALAMFVVPLTFLFLNYTEAAKTLWHRLAYLIVVILSLAALYVSHSQGGVLALLGGVLVYAMWLSWQTGKNSWTLWFLPIVFVLATIGLSSVLLGSGGNAVRQDIYHYSFTIISQHFWTGVGLGSFQNAVAALSSASPSFIQFGLPFALHAHNIFLSFWTMTGVIGLLAFLAVVVWIVGTLFQAKKQVWAGFIWAALVAILAHGLVDTTYFKNDLACIFWLVAALAVVIHASHEKRA